VHAYTGTGAVLAFAATQAATTRDFRTAFLWLFAAVLVDSTDGVLARAARVHDRLFAHSHCHEETPPMRKPIAILPALLLAAAAAFAAEPAPDFARQLDEFPRTQGTPSERLQRLFDLYWDWAMHEFPEGATYVGYPGQNHRWTDRSAEAMARRDALLPKGLAALQSICRARLTPDEQVNYDLFREQIEDGIEGMRFPGELLPVSQVGGVQQGIPQLLTQAPARTVQDYEDLLARLRGIPTVIDQTLALLEKGLKKGVTPPRVTLRDVPQQVANQIVEDPLKAPVLEAFTRFPVLLRNSVSLAVLPVKYWRTHNSPWNMKADSTTSPPSSFLPKGMV
jgi:hypothetical protein